MLERITPNRRKTLRPAVRRRLHPAGNRVRRTDWSLTADSFEKFLCWLSPDREEAGKKYEQLRKKLVKLFTWRGCHIPEELFDETVNRVAKKIALGAAVCLGHPFDYCFGVARMVLLEYWRKARPKPLPEDVPSPDISQPEWDETELDSLRQCLDRLSARDRDLITRYYQGEGRERIQIRREMASEGPGANALRIQIYRIRSSLRERYLRMRPSPKRETASFNAVRY